MKAYRGRINIECTRETGCLKNLKEDVQPGCMDCPEAISKIIDLEDKVIYEYCSPEIKTGKRVKPSAKPIKTIADKKEKREG